MPNSSSRRHREMARVASTPIDIALPNETLAAIFEAVSPPTLARLSCVSQRFRSVAERVLYSSINIVDVISSSSPAPYKSFQCCQSILKRGDLAEVVKNFHIRWQSQPNHPIDLPPLEPAFAPLHSTLRVLTQLESLELFLGSANLRAPTPTSLHAIERVIGGCQFPLLRQCLLGAEWAKGVQPYGGILTTFLVFTPTLRHLRLSDHHGALHLPPEALPFLSSFRGSPDTAAYLLPGRPVHSLSLVGQDSDVNRTNLPRLTQTRVPLRNLDLSGMAVRPMLLQNIASFIPSLEVLRVRLALRHTLHYAMSGIRILTGLSSVLNAFSSLIHLDLSPTTVDSLSQNHLSEEYGLCREWGRACGSLRQISFPSKNDWALSPLGRWELIGNANS